MLRARAYVFLGYPPGMKGYKLFDLHSKEVFVSRDVIFHESLFPFVVSSRSTLVIDLFPDLVLPKPATSLLQTPVTILSPCFHLVPMKFPLALLFHQIYQHMFPLALLPEHRIGLPILTITTVIY